MKASQGESVWGIRWWCCLHILNEIKAVESHT